MNAVMDDVAQNVNGPTGFGGPWLDAMIEASTKRARKNGTVSINLDALKIATDFIVDYQKNLYK